MRLSFWLEHPWRRRTLLALAGWAAMFGFAPYYYVPFLLLSFPLLVLVLDAHRQQESTPLTVFVDCLCFSFAHLFAGLFWISNAFLHEPAVAVAGFPVIALLALLLALFHGVVLAAGFLFWPHNSHPARFLLFAACWSLGEMGRGLLFTGLPWNLLGQVWLVSLPLAQSAAFVGVYGLSLLAAGFAATPAQFFTSAPMRQRIAPALLASGLLLLLGGLGAARLATGLAPPHEAALRIIQPAILQQDKLNRAKVKENLDRHLRWTKQSLTNAPENAPVFVVWPEAALLAVLERASLRRYLTQDLPPKGILITGALRREEGNLFNSLYALDAKGEILGFYDKVHLVPFGEYLPFRPLFALLGLRALAASRGSIAAGAARESFRLDGLPAFAPLICYEVIFSEEVPDTHTRPAFLLNITNDAWYGLSAGPHQHFAQAQMRALEQGLPLLRAANTGISGMIDPYGRINAFLPLGAEGFLAPALPQGLPPTLYARLGLAIPLLLLLAALGLFFALRPRIR